MSEVHLESPLPSALPPGSAVALFCSLSCWDGDRPVTSVQLVADGEPQELDAVQMPRFELPVRRSGFWGIVPVRAHVTAETLRLRARVEGLDGRRQEVELGSIAVAPPQPPLSAGPAAGSDELIAICMTTYEPDPELLRAQIDSIRAQSDGNWVCVISDDCSSPERYQQVRSLVDDDPRFVVSRNERRLEFYRNFEHVLRLAPAEAPLIALCDHDDVWHPDKLITLRTAIGSSTLVFSDQRLVDRSGRVLRETMWRGRSNNFTNLASLLLANTITGAASLMRREVVERALPFPDAPGIEFHDHWLALVALASGQVAYVDRPLYDYVQHREAILGKVTGEHSGGRRRRPRMRDWRASYFLGYVPGKIRARTLVLRCGDLLSADKSRALERYLSCERSPIGFAWLTLRPLRALGGKSETVGSEWELVPGLIWRWLATVLAAIPRWPEWLLLDTRFPDPPVLRHRRMERWRSRV